jgi:Rrf2 family protein
MRVSLQAQYAISALFDLAYNGHGEPIQVRVIGERQAIPARYLEQIFQRLRKADLVTGKRGPGGGYVLARPPDEISMRDVIEAVEGAPSEWVASEPGGIATPHRPDFLWPRMAAQFAALLAETTLEALCRDAELANVRHAEREAAMYYI